MKLKEYNSTTLPVSYRNSVGRITMTVNRSSGKFSLCRTLTDNLNVPQNGIVILQDEENPADWFIAVKEQDRLPLKKFTAGKYFTFGMCNRPLANRFLDSINAEGSATCLVAKEPNEEGLYAIITKSAKKRK